MPALNLKQITAVSVIVAALGYLGFAGLRAGVVYYVGVDELLTQLDRLGVRVRVHGVVGGERLASPDRAGSTSDGITRFDLHGTDRVLRVEYRGPVPDGFAAGREVVVEGVLNEQGSLDADVLMTKCASKYQGAGSTAKVPG